MVNSTVLKRFLESGPAYKLTPITRELMLLRYDETSPMDEQSIAQKMNLTIVQVRHMLRYGRMCARDFLREENKKKLLLEKLGSLNAPNIPLKELKWFTKDNLNMFNNCGVITVQKLQWLEKSEVMPWLQYLVPNVAHKISKLLKMYREAQNHENTARDYITKKQR